ncbi:hypothetical protein SLEP1_g18733 [Rubroshorea leprosula]|uniref:Autophagy-related protein n=1 Tax=Rubroshorea leprosula TaxID=152421 RepID=A0AAV5J7N5_9ROSI|nr:hypothetical protein SLEP1_g18733 [Rubroshorea leprosula]
MVFLLYVIKFVFFHALERRQAEAARIREKYPDRIPVIIERAEKSDVPDIDKKNLKTCRLLIPVDLTNEDLYILAEEMLPHDGALRGRMASIYINGFGIMSNHAVVGIISD